MQLIGITLLSLASARAFGSAARFVPAVMQSHGRAAVQLAVPTELAAPLWQAELQACCALSTGSGTNDGASDARMGLVLEWLQTMLVQLELGGTAELDGAEEDDELDEDFVNTARPWLHAKAFHDIACDPPAFSETLWAHVEGADYLRPGGAGGTMLLLLPSALSLSLFEAVTESVANGVSANVNADIIVTGCHPDATKAHERTPVPLLRVFLDAGEDMLVEGGSMSDAAQFL